MAQLSIAYGAVLILIALVGYFGTGRVSLTALIPAYFGLPVAILGMVALRVRDKARMHVMHAIVVIAVLAAVGTVRSLAGLVKLLSGGQVERPPAVYAQSATAIVSVLFVVICVKSFIDARRARQAAPPAHPD